jgi:ribosome-associated translation inhibitor RaiA
MQVQLNTDNHVAGSQNLSTYVDDEVRAKLRRFADKITRVEVHLHDLNSAKTTGDDKRCTIESRVAGKPPVGVTHDAAVMDRAIHGALEKMIHALDKVFGKAEASRHTAVVAPTDEAPL